MNIRSAEKSVVVKGLGELAVDGVYMIRGTTLSVDKDKYGNALKTFSRHPIPPQLVVILSPPSQTSCWVYFWCDDGVEPFGYKVLMPLSDVNIPEHGQHDRYLEKIPDATVLSGMHRMEQQNREQNYMEMSMDKQTWAKEYWQ